MTLSELFARFPDDEAAERWFEKQRWPDGPSCPDCGHSGYSRATHHRTMPYRCTSCCSYFSVRKGTVMQSSKLGYRIWAIAIYLVNTSLKGVSSMKLHRDLGITQASAWHLLQRIREGFDIAIGKLEGVVEVDEMFVGGKQKNRHRAQRSKHSGYDFWGKKPVVGAVQRGGRVIAMPVDSVDGPTLVAFVEGNVRFGSRVYTDDHGGYEDLMESYMHRTVRHSIGQYVRDYGIHTNTIESLWSMFKRAFIGVYHQMSFKHLHRYVTEACWHYNVRDLDTLDQMAETVRGMVGKRLRWAELVA
ncbi:MAG: IS1595 family transposase [Acidobacteriota bacterium]|nr:IS1595 family transposase [Acidobacteriota bacterium]MDE3264626.1 IS1595 family transposase [Acidobacteriota bacterium]